MKDERSERGERLDAIRRELEKQEDALQRLHAMAARLGDVELAVPQDVLDQIIGENSESAAPLLGVRA